MAEFNASDRINRMGFALRILGSYAVFWLFGMCGGYIYGNSVLAAVLLAIVVVMAFSLMLISAIFRRLHDLGRQATEIVWMLVPIVNIVLLVDLFLKEGSLEPNQYGQPPRGVLGSGAVAIQPGPSDS